jgi:hypothetical protein
MMKRALVLLFIASCGGAAAVPAPRAPRLAPPAMNGTATCAIEAKAKMPDDEPIFATAKGGAAIARFTRMDVRVATTSIVSGRPVRAAIVVRAPASGPAMVLRGWVDVDRLSLRAKRDLPVVAPWVVIGSDQPVRAIAADGALVRVASRYGEMRSLSADTPCDALTLDRGAPSPPETKGEYMHFTNKSAVLFDRPGGAALLEVPFDREMPTVLAVDAAAGMHRVHYLDGVRLDAWVRDSDLEPGYGPDCDDCHGGIEDVMDRCPTPSDSDDNDGCPELADVNHRARVASPVRTKPANDGPIVGEIEPGVLLAVLGRRPGFAHVLPADGEIRGEGGVGLWVDASALDPVRK